MRRNIGFWVSLACASIAAIAAGPVARPEPPQMFEDDSKVFVLRALESAGQPGGPYADGLLVVRPGGRLSEEQRALVEARADALIEIYKDSDDPRIKECALSAMANGGVFAPASVRATLADLGAELCTTSNDGQTVFAGVKLVALGASAEHVPALMAAIKREDYAEGSFTTWETLSMLRERGVRTLARCGEAAIPPLIELFDNADSYGVSKFAAAVTLCRVGSRARIDYVLDAAGLSGAPPSKMAITYLPYAWPLLTSEEKDAANELVDRLLVHEKVSIRSMAARWAIKCDKDRFAEKVQALHDTDSSQHVKKNARQALMEAGLVEKDEGALLSEQVGQFFQQRRQE